MEIHTKQSTMVHPAQDTPKQRLWTSHLDLLMTRYHIPTVYYKTNGSSNFFEAPVLKGALRKVLVPFYPLAGRLGRDAYGRIEIHNKAEGLLFIETGTDAIIDDFGDFTPSEKLWQLVPTVDYSCDLSSYPFLVLQCGGVCLGVGVQHILADGISALHFINKWSDMARGLSTSITPFIYRTLLHARNPPIPTFRHIEYDPSPSLVTPIQTQEFQSNPKAISTSILKITLDQIHTLKAESKKDENTRYNTYELLAVHIWRCMCKACGLSNDQSTKLYMPINGRFRLHPPLPPGYFGNVIYMAISIALSDDIQSEQLNYTVERIHDALKWMDDEYLRSAIDYLEIQPDLMLLVRGTHRFRCPNLSINSWTRLPIYDTDFGWGRPIFMGLASFSSEGKAYILPVQAMMGACHWLYA